LPIEHHRAGRLNEAEPIYRQILAQSAGHRAGLVPAGPIAGPAGQYGPAIEAVRQGGSRRSRTRRIFITSWANACVDPVRIDEAIAAHSRAAQADPNNADSFNSLGNCCGKRGAPARRSISIVVPSRCGRCTPRRTANMGNALKSLGEFDASIAAHRKAVALKPESAEILNNFGTALKGKRRHRSGYRRYMRSVNLRPDYPEVLNNLGSVLILRDRVQEAIAAFSRAAELNPSAPEIQNNLGNVLQKSGNLDASVAAYRKALSLRPDFAEAHSNLAINLTSQGRLDEALVSFRKALECKEDSQYHGQCALHASLPFRVQRTANLEETPSMGMRVSRSHYRVPTGPTRISRILTSGLKIGYVSPDFRHHPVARFLAAALRANMTIAATTFIAIRGFCIPTS